MIEVHKMQHHKVPDKRIKHLLANDRDLDTKLYVKDHMMNIGIRLGFNRFDYKVPPGLYAINHPESHDDVVVTCNYKLTVDIVRNSLKMRSVWLLVLDTDGVNVWCAAGKGSFGTAELVYSLNKFEIAQQVNHKRLILPQLGGPGIQAHLVKATTGFNVIYGPVKASDLPKFIDDDYTASDEMRKINFATTDRLKVTHLEVVTVMKYLLYLFFVSLLMSLFFKTIGLHDVLKFVGIYAIGTFSGALFMPLLLPFMPFRMFYKNGLFMALMMLLPYLYYFKLINIFALGNVIISTAIAGYVAMNFTGSTTFTSLSGVKKEMEQAIPVLAMILLLGLILTILSLVMGVFV